MIQLLLELVFYIGVPDLHGACMQEHEMKPSPDYGLESYKGSGKLKNKVI